MPQAAPDPRVKLALDAIYLAADLDYLARIASTADPSTDLRHWLVERLIGLAAALPAGSDVRREAVTQSMGLPGLARTVLVHRAPAWASDWRAFAERTFAAVEAARPSPQRLPEEGDPCADCAKADALLTDARPAADRQESTAPGAGDALGLDSDARHVDVGARQLLADVLRDADMHREQTEALHELEGALDEHAVRLAREADGGR